jgi:energy-coupling factor transporter ATP-binding protein EcfA2
MQELKLIHFDEIQSERMDFLWEPFIAKGKISLIQGDPGCGKTTLAIAVAAAVTRGEEVGGSGVYASPADVIFQPAEDGPADTIKPKLELMGAVCSRVHAIDESERALALNDNRIERAIIETGAAACFIDPIQVYCKDMHSVNGVRPLLKHLAGVAERTGAALVLIGHLNKHGGKSAYRGLGSIDIYAAARSVLTVGKLPSDGNLRAVVQTKNNLATLGKPQAFGFDEFRGFTWLGGCDATVDEILRDKPKAESQFAKARRLLESILANGQPVASVEIMERAEREDISPKTLNRAKSELGVISIKRGGKWFWQLPIEVVYTDDGRQDGQGGQDSAATALTTLTILDAETEVR